MRLAIWGTWTWFTTIKKTLSRHVRANFRVNAVPSEDESLELTTAAGLVRGPGSNNTANPVDKLSCVELMRQRRWFLLRPDSSHHTLGGDWWKFYVELIVCFDQEGNGNLLIWIATGGHYA